MTQQAQVVAHTLPASAPASAISHAIPRPAPIRVSPGAITLVAAPVTVIATMLVGYTVLTLAGIPVHAGEMTAGAIVNMIGGVLAAVALFKMIKKGATGVAQAGILGIGLRCGAVLLGLMVAGMPLFGLDRTILVYWVMSYYFPMLIVESALVAWLSHRVSN